MPCLESGGSKYQLAHFVFVSSLGHTHYILRDHGYRENARAQVVGYLARFPLPLGFELLGSVVLTRFYYTISMVFECSPFRPRHLQRTRDYT